MANTKPLKRKPPKIVFDKEFKKKRLQISIDRYNWIRYYGPVSISRDAIYYKYYSNIQALCSGLLEAVLKSHTKDLNPEKIRSIVDESEGYIVDMVNDIKRLFEETPFITPERKHEENKQ